MTWIQSQKTYLTGDQMKTFQMRQKFGVVCGDGTLALSFLYAEILPALNAGEKIQFDFEGVRVINSSFSNAFFGNLLKLNGKNVLANIAISHACPLVKAEIKSGIAYGAKHANQIAA